ncbi:MAG: ATP-binding protein [Pseudohongiella sp.]|nr:ATP-binding protein [Pseudohongiella sp.]
MNRHDVQTPRNNTQKHQAGGWQADKSVQLENRLALFALAACLVPSLLLIAALAFFGVSVYLLGLVSVFLLFLVVYCVSTIWRQTQFQFRSLHNLLAAIVSGDYSFRGARKPGSGAFGELIATINELADTLQRQRLESEESQLLVQKVVDQIDVAIVAWDQTHHIRLTNPAARRLLQLAPSDLEPSDAPQLPAVLIEACATMSVGETSVKHLRLSQGTGRYRLHLEQFIVEGDTHFLLFITNISSILRVEERRAWRNLVRVLSHEINNSLSPLKSFSNTLMAQIEKRERDIQLKQELMEGLTVIGRRADSLANFVQNYHTIARLPEPEKKPCDIQLLMRSLSKLFPEACLVLDGEPCTVALDSSQFEQVLINLIKNAMEASGKQDEIVLRWRQEETRLMIRISDQGMGIQNPENLFTPYYSTKPGGSGIGLVFCQQVIEAHDGSLILQNRQQGQGCEVIISLPLW